MISLGDVPFDAVRRSAGLQAARNRADTQLRKQSGAGATTRPATEDGITVYFSPRGGCTDAIVQRIAKAKTSIQIQAYRLTSSPVAKAILEAHKRGVTVTILLDKAQQITKYSDATFYHNLGMTVLIDRAHAIAHNKTIIVDGATVITGSFNFSMAAEMSNAENLLVIEGKPALAAAYVQSFEQHKAHCEAYRPPTGAAESPETRPAVEADPAGSQAAAEDDSELLHSVR